MGLLWVYEGVPAQIAETRAGRPGWDHFCHSRSVNPLSSVYNAAIRPSRIRATS
jgi:hypothetical protein